MIKLSTIKKIILRIISTPRIIFALYQFEKAWNLVSKQKFIEAKNKFFFGEKFIKKIPYEYGIMKAQISFNLGERENCINLHKKNLYDIENDKNISLNKKQYLKEYILTSIKICDKSFKLKSVDIQEIDLKKIDDTTKRTFPLRHHPDWDKYGNKN